MQTYLELSERTDSPQISAIAKQLLKDLEPFFNSSIGRTKGVHNITFDELRLVLDTSLQRYSCKRMGERHAETQTIMPSIPFQIDNYTSKWEAATKISNSNSRSTKSTTTNNSSVPTTIENFQAILSQKTALYRADQRKSQEVIFSSLLCQNSESVTQITPRNEKEDRDVSEEKSNLEHLVTKNQGTNTAANISDSEDTKRDKRSTNSKPGSISLDNQSFVMDAPCRQTTPDSLVHINNSTPSDSKLLSIDADNRYSTYSVMTSHSFPTCIHTQDTFKEQNTRWHTKSSIISSSSSNNSLSEIVFDSPHSSPDELQSLLGNSKSNIHSILDNMTQGSRNSYKPSRRTNLNHSQEMVYSQIPDALSTRGINSSTTMPLATPYVKTPSQSYRQPPNKWQLDFSNFSNPFEE